MVGVDEARELAGLVLCGGGSRRMGIDKALLVVDGERLVDRAARRLGAVADPVILACGARPLVVAGCTTVSDAVAEAGPLAGLVAGLTASPHTLTAAVAVDMPGFDTQLLVAMSEQWAGEDALIPVSDRGPEPLHGVYARSALPALAQALLAGRLRLRTVTRTLRVRHVVAAELVGASRASQFAVNLNTPADLLTPVVRAADA